ncbi:serine hydrolase domain-containing protein [Ramlibacter sp.]|uniref:serine hydrolase domain-containing protein n=1 Tax=Ramlibacter sp. TaxID=1917967 RepID=UPI00262C03BA|nr:serine hydrolase domain-containing protein [Ramlibacter sp.]
MNPSALDADLQARVDREELPGASYAVLRAGEVIAQGCVGWADREARAPLREDHLFRIFSNTKLVTSCAALQLVEQGRLRVDDPVGDYIPALRKLRVLKPGATSLADTEAAREPVRIRHLMTHTAGFTYGFTQPDAPIAKAYADARILHPALDLGQMCEALATVPLLFQPGAAWNYSIATDVLGHVVELVQGQALDACFRRQVFEPLGMQDTFFFVPPEKQARLASLYIGDRKEPLRPGLQRADRLPYEGAYVRPAPLLGGGGGLVSTLGDYVKLVCALSLGGAPLLAPETMRLVTGNQLPAGLWIGFPGAAMQTGRGHSFAASVRVEPCADDASSVPGEVQWGGLAGTKWCFSPREQLAVVLMTQRYAGSELPYWGEFKAVVRAALHA